MADPDHPIHFLPDLPDGYPGKSLTLVVGMLYGMTGYSLSICQLREEYGGHWAHVIVSPDNRCQVVGLIG
jgi:hypothetical protein